jgi:GNAT superfamily N-acetyltransferase
MRVNVEPCAKADLDTVASIWLSSWRSTGLPVSELVSFDELRSRLSVEVERGWSVYVAKVEAHIVGFIALHDDWLMQLYVAPNTQNKGVGKFLLDFAKAQRPQGFHLDTAAESGAVRFYEREGLTRGEVTIHPRFGHPIVRYDWLPG